VIYLTVLHALQRIWFNQGPLEYEGLCGNVIDTDSIEGSLPLLLVLQRGKKKNLRSVQLCWAVR